MKLVTNIQHVNGKCCKDFQGQMSKDKARLNTVMVEACISMVWCRGVLICPILMKHDMWVDVDKLYAVTKFELIPPEKFEPFPPSGWRYSVAKLVFLQCIYP